MLKMSYRKVDMKTYSDQKRRKKPGEDKKINKKKRNEVVGTEKRKNVVKRKESGVANGTNQHVIEIFP